jgi:hypothetical protein
LPVSVMARWFDLSFQGAAAAEQESSLAA